MATPQTNPGTARPKRGPKARGRTVYPLTIAVTVEQRALLESIADREQVTISAVVRRLIAVGFATESDRAPHAA